MANGRTCHFTDGLASFSHGQYVATSRTYHITNGLASFSTGQSMANCRTYHFTNGLASGRFFDGQSLATISSSYSMAQQWWPAEYKVESFRFRRGQEKQA
jgi:hypothetical protein